MASCSKHKLLLGKSYGNVSTMCRRGRHCTVALLKVPMFSAQFSGTFRRKQRHLRGTKGRRLLHVPPSTLALKVPPWGQVHLAPFRRRRKDGVFFDGVLAPTAPQRRPSAVALGGPGRSRERHSKMRVDDVAV